MTAAEFKEKVMPEQIATIVRDWWGFAAFIVGGILAYSAGKERQRYKVDRIGRDVETLSRKVDRQGEEIERMRNEESANALHSTEVLTKLITSQGHIIQMLEEVKAELKGKVDKK